MTKKVYLTIAPATFIKKIGVNEIYTHNKKFYIALESLTLGGDDAEHCIECDAFDEAEKITREINNLTPSEQ